MKFAANAYATSASKLRTLDLWPDESEWHHESSVQIRKAPAFGSIPLVKITPSAVPMKHRKAFTIGNTADLFTFKPIKRGAERNYRGKQYQRHLRRVDNNVY